MLIAIERKAREKEEIHLREDVASRGNLVVVACERQHAKRAGFEYPDLANTESAIDVQLVDGARGDDDLERDVRNVAIRVQSEHQARLSELSVTVFVRAGPDDLKTLTDRDVFAEIDLRGSRRGTYRDRLVKVTLPRNIGLVKVVPEQVNVTLF
jgi:hypothetical protein